MNDPGRRVSALGTILEGRDLAARLDAAWRHVPGRLVFTTSFGLEDQAITHAIAETGLDIEIATLDTGRLFPETHDVWAATEARYGLRIVAFAPQAAAIEGYVAENGVNAFRNSIALRQLCCGLRKVEPLRRALAGAAGWITGLRAAQSEARAATPLAAFDEAHGLIKISPLADWSRDEIAAYLARHDVPLNALHGRGFPSIGCAPCTRAVAPGEPERAGRWWWESEEKKECGLHLPRQETPSGIGAARAIPRQLESNP